MKWMKLTQHSGEEVFVNLAQVVYVQPYEQSGLGRRLITAQPDANGNEL